MPRYSNVPNPTFACTMFFEGGKFGWSETLYRDVATHDQAMLDLQVLAGVRKLCLPHAYQLVSLKVSEVHTPGDVKLLVMTGKDRDGKLAGGTADEPWQGFLIRQEATNQVANRYIILRGVYDSELGEANVAAQFATPEPLGNPYINYFNAMKGWKFIGVDKTVAAVAVTNVTIGNLTKVITVTAAGHGLTTGDYTLLKDVQGVRDAKGKHRVIVTDANTFTLKDLAVNTGDTYLQGGTSRREKLILMTIGDSQYVRPSHRQTGRPSDSPRGVHRRKRAAS